MSNKPIFAVTVPRSCSTAFERVFLTRPDLKVIHEPFSKAYYYGPDRFSPRFNDREDIRQASIHPESFRDVLDKLEGDIAQGKRVFIKDMAYQIVPPPSHGTPDAVHKAFLSSGSWTGSATNGANQTHEGLRNPSVLPLEVLQKFHWIFLIRHPSCSIPSYYRTTIPPQTEITKFDYYDPAEAGYKELRLLFDYLRATGQVGPEIAGQETASGADGKHSQTSICLLDADDLLDKPALAIEQICKSVGIKFDPAMLKWDTPEDKTMASDLFSAWVGWHDDAIKSKGLQPRDHAKRTKTPEQEDAEWKEKYGEEAAKIIRKTVDENLEDYAYLKQFAFKV